MRWLQKTDGRCFDLQTTGGQLLWNWVSGTIERLSSAEQTAVREANLAFIRDQEIVRVPTNVLYAVATKKK
jgi:hypothetical protein